MANNYVNVNAIDAGKKVEAWDISVAGTTVLREIDLIGEPYLASYTASFTATTLATANSHLLQIMAGASLNVYIRRIQLFQLGLATTAAFAQFNVTRLTTAGTGGTAITPAPLDTGDTAGATAMSLPTVLGTLGTVIARTTAYLQQTAAASLGPPQPLLDITFDGLRYKSLRIPAGTANGIAISNITAVAGAPCTVLPLVWLSEANF